MRPVALRGGQLPLAPGARVGGDDQQNTDRRENAALADWNRGVWKMRRSATRWSLIHLRLASPNARLRVPCLDITLGLLARGAGIAGLFVGWVGNFLVARR